MKVNKKAILGMLVAMVMSLGVMGGINAKNSDSNLMGCAYAYYSMSENSTLNAGISAFAAGYGSSLGIAGAIAASNPVGWVAIGLGICAIG